MRNYPDFSPQNYRVISELGRNREGGRITWLALDINTNQQVVLKQFCFAASGSNWSAFDAHQREVEILQGLNHPGIPRYLGAIETPDGFFLIQEYKEASTLAVQRSFESNEIKQIAVKTLEILVYLQNRIPPIIHRDIKPENILVDNQLNVYLIDFGMSLFGNQNVSGSSVFKGTPGFIPPEQIRQSTKASDLYSLGATLICLLTGTPSNAIHDLTDDNQQYYQINFRSLLPQLSIRFQDWLELMVQPSLEKRFINAETALEALLPLDIIRVPEISLSQSVLECKATRLGERLTQTIIVTNSVPDTVLEGKWEIAPHLQDPPHTPNAHAWISVKPVQFACNNIECHIQLDTSKLMADKLYKRQLLLHTNAYPATYPLTLQVKTAPLPIEKQKQPYTRLIKVLLSCAIASVVITWSMGMGMGVGVAVAAAIAWLVVVAVGVGWTKAVKAGIFALAVITFVVWVMAKALVMAGASAEAGVLAMIVAGIVVGASSLCVAVNQVLFVKDLFTFVQLILTAGLGICFGVSCIVGLLNSYIIGAIALTGLPILTMLFYPPFKRRQLITKYRQSEECLIRP